MATRKDMKGRILRRGESQRKDGRYCFKYVDARGKTRSVYSWTLTTHDFTPKGKRSSPCLRELEQRIQRDLFDNVAPENMTVLELATKYTETKTAVRPTTRTGYKTVLNFLADNEFGGRRIRDITTLDAKEWLISLQRDHGSDTARSIPYAVFCDRRSSSRRKMTSFAETRSISSLRPFL